MVERLLPTQYPNIISMGTVGNSFPSLSKRLNQQGVQCRIWQLRRCTSIFGILASLGTKAVDRLQHGEALQVRCHPGNPCC